MLLLGGLRLIVLPFSKRNYPNPTLSHSRVKFLNCTMSTSDNLSKYLKKSSQYSHSVFGYSWMEDSRCSTAPFSSSAPQFPVIAELVVWIEDLSAFNSFPVLPPPIKFGPKQFRVVAIIPFTPSPQIISPTVSFNNLFVTLRSHFYAVNFSSKSRFFQLLYLATQPSLTLSQIHNSALQHLNIASDINVLVSSAFIAIIRIVYPDTRTCIYYEVVRKDAYWAFAFYGVAIPFFSG